LSSANMPPENPQANRVIFDFEKVRVPRVVGFEDVETRALGSSYGKIESGQRL